MIGQFIANVFFPRRDLQYFELYFHFWRRCTRQGVDSQTKKQQGFNNCREAWLVRLMIGLSFLEALKYAYLVSTYRPSIITRILLYDGFSLLMPNQQGMSFNTFIGIVMIIRLTELTYFQGERWAFESLGEMIFLNRATTFLWRDGSPLVEAERRKNVCNQLIAYTKWLLPCGQLITIFVYILIFIGNYRILVIVQEHLDELAPTTLVFALNLVILVVNTVLGLTVLIIFKHVLLLNAAVGLVLMKLATLRMAQIEAYLRFKGFIATWTGRGGGSHRLVPTLPVINRLHWIVATNLKYIAEADRGLYSQVFFSFMIGSVPITLNLLFWAFFAQNAFQSVALYTFALLLSIGLFGVHNELAQYGKKIHAPVRHLYAFLTQTVMVEGLLEEKKEEGDERGERVIDDLANENEEQGVENGDWDDVQAVVYTIEAARRGEATIVTIENLDPSEGINYFSVHPNFEGQQEQEEDPEKATEEEEWRQLATAYHRAYNGPPPVPPIPVPPTTGRRRPFKEIPLNGRLKLDWIITTLATTHKYGSTYGATKCTVTTNSFHKFVRMFSKFFITTFKLQKKFAGLFMKAL